MVLSEHVPHRFLSLFPFMIQVTFTIGAAFGEEGHAKTILAFAADAVESFMYAAHTLFCRGGS